MRLEIFVSSAAYQEDLETEFREKGLISEVHELWRSHLQVQTPNPAAHQIVEPMEAPALAGEFGISVNLVGVSVTPERTKERFTALLNGLVVLCQKTIANKMRISIDRGDLAKDAEVHLFVTITVDRPFFETKNGLSTTLEQEVIVTAAAEEANES